MSQTPLKIGFLSERQGERRKIPAILQAAVA